MAILCSVVTLLESAIAMGLQGNGELVVGMGFAM